MKAYYNEFDADAANWLRELIKCGAIADGEVDTRSIEDVRPNDLRGFSQCHFFAGIGGWSYALRLAGWPDDTPIWTGSCPCQPFSAAGKGDGFADERHLWPAFFHLIRECRPGVIFGEQVEAAINHKWLDLVQTDLEGEDYTFGAVGIPAAGVGAPHIRQRLWWVADSLPARRAERRAGAGSGSVAGGGELSGMGDSHRKGLEGRGFDAGEHPDKRTAGAPSELSGVGDSASKGLFSAAHGRIHSAEEISRTWNGEFERSSASSAVADTASIGRQRGRASEARHEPRPEQRSERLRDASAVEQPTGEQVGLPRFSWLGRNAEWIPCRDGKWRPAEPGTFPLAHGIPARVGRLRGYGNAIVPQVAAEVIRAYMASV